MIVMKFGGTSNQDAAAMRNVIGIVKAHLSLQPVIVISAIAKATNELEAIARSAACGNRDDAWELIERLINRHRTIAQTLVHTEHRLAKLETLLNDSRNELRQLVVGLAILHELTPRTLDAFCSFGERLSSSIVSSSLEDNAVDAVWVDAREFMITDDNFGRALPLMDRVTPQLRAVVGPLLGAGKTPVTQGFVGATVSGVPTTMGRESSDFSASIIGAAMDAELVQIWTDVDGILTADPKLVRDIYRIRALSYEEAFELSYFGAKVLHPNTLLPLVDKKIPLEIRNSRTSLCAGTRVDIGSGLHDRFGGVKSIAYQKGIVVFSVRPFRRSDPYLFWESLFSILSRHGIRPGVSTTSEYRIAFAVSEKNDLTVLTQELSEFGYVEAHGGRGSITMVGEGMNGEAGLTARICGVLAHMKVSLISFGASDLNLTLVVEESCVEDAVNLLHAEFFAAQGMREGFEAVERLDEAEKNEYASNTVLRAAKQHDKKEGT